MKSFFHRLAAMLDVSGRDAPAFLLSLFLAFSIWLIHNLTLNYTDYISVPVIAEADMDGYASRSSDRGNVVARCRTTGYNIVKASLGRNKPVTVHFGRMRRRPDGVFYVTAADLQRGDGQEALMQLTRWNPLADSNSCSSG